MIWSPSSLSNAPPAVRRVLDALENVKKSGSNWTARCPAHQDRQNSLSVGVGAEGRVLLHCHAGCAWLDILGALRLETRDLFEPSWR